MARRPKLLTFSRSYKKSLEPAADEELIEDLETGWYKFWLEFGEDFVNTSWCSLYKNFVDFDLGHTNQGFTDSVELEKDLETFSSGKPSETQLDDLIAVDKNKLELDESEDKHLDKLNLNLSEKQGHKEETDNLDEYSDWKAIWDDHYSSEYESYFTLYSEVYEIARKRFEIDDDEAEISSAALNELEQMKALGLPTSFGQKLKNKKDKFEELDQSEYFDVYWDSEDDKEINKFSSEEDNSNSDVDSDDHNKEGCKENTENISEINPKKQDIIGEKEEFIENIPEIINIEMEDNLQKSSDVQNRKRKRKRITTEPPAYILKDKILLKFWRKRFMLFSKFDQGIQMDRESWFSVTPEKIAINIAKRMENFNIIVDGFCGSGGNCIQMAMKCVKVIAIDIDPIKVQMAKHNAEIYHVDNKIDFIVGDFLEICESLKADAIFLSPPWGGPKYAQKPVYDIEKNLEPVGVTELLKKCRNVTKNICLYLPKNSDIKDIVQTAGAGNQVEVEQNYFGGKIVALTAYYGDLIKKN